MKVICINYGYKVHPEINGYIKEGAIYTVKAQFAQYSEIAQRIVEVYEFEEVDGYYECGMFAPLSNFDERLIHCLHTKPLSKNKLNKKMSNCSNHKKEILGQSDMKHLAEDMGNLHYESLAIFLFHLETKLRRDSQLDLLCGRKNLSIALANAAKNISLAWLYIKKAYEISKPFMERKN